MDNEKLSRLLQTLEGTSVRELEYADGDLKIKLTRGPRTCSAPPAATVANTRAASDEVAALPARQSTNAKHEITAGLTGTFYRAPAPGQDPFVSIGDTVEEGQTIAVVEAMKLLNTIEAERAGTIVSIFPEDGASVSPDTVLFAIEPLEVLHV